MLKIRKCDRMVEINKYEFAGIWKRFCIGGVLQMELIISLVISAVLLGVPTWLIVRAVKKAEKNTIVYSPEEVTQRLKKGFFLSNWGIELAFGSVLSFALMFCDIHIVIKFAIPIGSVIVGLIMFFIGRF